MQTNFLGKNGFIWWVGIVQNRIDPLGLGRCQVRIFGYHGDFSISDTTTTSTYGIDTNSPAYTNIPTESLPWAMPLYPVNNSKTFMAPSLGDWCVGFFMDGESAQMPIIMGVLPGYGQVSAPVDDNPPQSTGIEEA